MKYKCSQFLCNNKWLRWTLFTRFSLTEPLSYNKEHSREIRMMRLQQSDGNDMMTAIKAMVNLMPSTRFFGHLGPWNASLIMEFLSICTRSRIEWHESYSQLDVIHQKKKQLGFFLLLGSLECLSMNEMSQYLTQISNRMQHCCLDLNLNPSVSSHKPI